MKETLATLMNWGPVYLLVILAVLGIIYSLAGATTIEERRLRGQEGEHYVLRQPLSRIGKPLILLVIGGALQGVFFLLGRFLTEPVWLLPVIKLAGALLFGILFWIELAKVVRQRVFVDGDRILYTPAVGARVETTFGQIRTVANKVVGGDGGVVGKKIKTKEGTRFEVINTMDGYETFCAQLDEKVELPNLTKKLFKKKDKKEETWEDEAIPTGTDMPAPTMEAAPVPEEGVASMTEAAADPAGMDPVQPEAMQDMSVAEPQAMPADPAPVPHPEIPAESAQQIPQATDEVTGFFPEEAPKEE